MPHAGHPPGGPRPPWQASARAFLALSGLTLLVVVEVGGALVWLAWMLIGLALATEAVATVAYWRRSRPGR